LSSNSTFGADPFSATSQPKQGSPLPPNVPNNLPSSTPPASSAGHHHPPKPMQAGPVQGISSVSSHTSQLPHSQPAPRQQQFNATPSAPGPVSSNIPSGQIPSNPSQSQAPWPKITQVDVRKYMIVFIKVDRDRDGKITGEEARNLFLSWRLPRGTSSLFIFTLPFLDTIIHSPCALYFCPVDDSTNYVSVIEVLFNLQTHQYTCEIRIASFRWPFIVCSFPHTIVLLLRNMYFR